MRQNVRRIEALWNYQGLIRPGSRSTRLHDDTREVTDHAGFRFLPIMSYFESFSFHLHENDDLVCGELRMQNAGLTMGVWESRLESLSARSFTIRRP